MQQFMHILQDLILTHCRYIWYIQLLRYPLYQKQLWNSKVPSITIAWLVSRKHDTWSQSYAMQQPTQSGTKRTRWPGFNSGSSDSYSSYPSNSSDEEYSKLIKRTKSKMCFCEPIKKCAKLIVKLLTSEYKLKVIKLKLDKDPLQHPVCFLYFMNSLKIILSQLKEIYMFLMKYPYITGEYFPYYD